eukprot:gene16433-biopygen17255
MGGTHYGATWILPASPTKKEGSLAGARSSQISGRTPQAQRLRCARSRLAPTLQRWHVYGGRPSPWTQEHRGAVHMYSEFGEFSF